jgi:protein required for attachment to host cells
MKSTWIVAADASRAKVLQVTGRQEQLEEIEDLLNPEGRLRDSELARDALGRWSGPDRPGGNSMPDPVSPAEHAVEKFARRVGDYLDKARTEHRFEALVLVAPPEFLGTLRAELTKEVEKLVVRELPKDLSSLSARELEGWLAKESGREP